MVMMKTPIVIDEKKRLQKLGIQKFRLAVIASLNFLDLLVFY